MKIPGDMLKLPFYYRQMKFTLTVNECLPQFCGHLNDYRWIFFLHLVQRHRKFFFITFLRRFYGNAH